MSIDNKKLKLFILPIKKKKKGTKRGEQRKRKDSIINKLKI